MKSFVIVLTGLGLCWLGTDLASDSVLANLLAPMGVLLFTLSLAVWLVLKTAMGTKSATGKGYGGVGRMDFTGGDACGGDGGCD